MFIKDCKIQRLTSKTVVIKQNNINITEEYDFIFFSLPQVIENQCIQMLYKNLFNKKQNSDCTLEHIIFTDNCAQKL